MQKVINLIVSTNLMCFVGLLYLLFLTFKNPLFERKQRRLFIYSILINLFMLAAVSLDYVFAAAEFPAAFAFRRVTSFINFAGSPLIPVFLILIFEIKKRKLYFFIPLILNSLICFISMFWPIVFNITDENNYGRGVLFFMPITITVIYTIWLMVEPSTKQIRAQRNERLFLLSIIFLVFFTMYLEIGFRFHFLSWCGAAIGIIMYYIFLNIHYFTSDKLTGAYNRQTYELELTNIKGRRACYLIAMDINGLKYANDTFGHAAGDKLLSDYGRIFDQHTRKCADFYRIGGDEFFLIVSEAKYELFRDSFRKVLRDTEQEGISFAWGEAHYDGKNDLDAFVQKADRLMYEKKREMKQTKQA